MSGRRPAGDTTRTVVPRAAFVPGQGAWSFLVIDRGSSHVIALPAAGPLVVGRGGSADVALVDPSVSRRHARVEVRADGVVLTDLGSRNGVRVGGQPVTGERPLHAGEVVAVGEVTLVLRGGPRAATVSAPAAAATESRTLGDRLVLLTDPAMIRLFALIDRVALTDLPVLVVGETGVGKEHAAFAVHHGSARRAGPFVPVNCAAIPANLVESELFGHDKGAFSGAHTAREGLFERAEGGTLFLDEIGELDLGAQAKLLRVLDGGGYTRLGEARERKASVRVVAATNRDLEAEVAARRFRMDLLYRLNGAVVMIPPLRERPADLPVLARSFLAAARARAGLPPLELGAAALAALAGHGWPGNVRELRNAMELLAATAPAAVVEPAHLPPSIGGKATSAGEPAAAAGPPPPISPGPLRPIADELSALERQRMEEALVAAGGVKTRAAQLISMPERTFRLKLRQYGLDGAVTGKPRRPR